MITTTSCEHWCGWIALRCDQEQVDKAARPYRHISQTRKWMRRQSFQVPNYGHNQVMDRPHWNEILDALQEDVDFCEDGETTIARDGAIPIPGVSISPTMVRRQLKKTRYHRYYCKLYQLSDTLGTGPSERISMLHRSPEVSSVPDEVQVSEIRDRA